MPASGVETDNQAETEAVRARLSRIRHKILVLSGKGGVGKSTVAANLAAALAARGKRVGLLDVDIHGPSIPQLLGVSGATVTLAGTAGRQALIQPVAAAPNLHVMSIAFLLEDRNSAVIWRGPMKYTMIKQFIQDVDWGSLDVLVVDSPPGTGDEPLSAIQLLGTPAGAVVVTTPQDLAVADVRRCVTFCRKLNLPVLGIVENMSGFVCPACGVRSDIFKSGGGRAMADDMAVDFLGSIPIDPRLVEAGDGGILGQGSLDVTEAGKALSLCVQNLLDRIRSLSPGSDLQTEANEKQKEENTCE
jgi:ATP-binding protein involved in chromosome partitioning